MAKWELAHSNRLRDFDVSFSWSDEQTTVWQVYVLQAILPGDFNVRLSLSEARVVSRKLLALSDGSH